MPTYTVTNSNFNLTSKQQKKLAEGITKVHNVVTGANTYFAQVIFNKTKKNNHFMGGKKVTEPSLFLHGQIRAGRPKETKDKIRKKLHAAKHYIVYPWAVQGERIPNQEVRKKTRLNAMWQMPGFSLRRKT